MRVSEISNRLNVSPNTVRYYSRIELVRPSKSDNGYKHYTEKDFRKLRFAIRAKALGFSLSDIKKLIDISDNGQTPCPHAREIIASNLDLLGASIRESLNLFQRMERAAAIWQDMPDKEPNGETICSLIDGLSEGESHAEVS
jgi:DNA-binding transcriptional MerR regulator